MSRNRPRSTLPRGHGVTAQTAMADATCGRVSRLAICTNHPLDSARPDPDASGSLTTTHKSGDDVTIKPPAIARFPRGTPPGCHARHCAAAPCRSCARTPPQRVRALPAAPAPAPGCRHGPPPRASTARARGPGPPMPCAPFGACNRRYATPCANEGAGYPRPSPAATHGP